MSWHTIQMLDEEDAMRKFLIIFSLLFSCQLYAEKDMGAEKALKAYLKEDLPNYEVAYFDLNGDSVQDAFIYLNDRDWCGSGGCTSLIFLGTTDGFKFRSKLTITNKPVIVSPNKTNGWFDLIVSTGGIGQVVLKFNGSKYPGNPSMQPKATEQQLNGATTILR